MNEDHEIQTPNFEGEAMKMPENTDQPAADTTGRSSLISGPLLLLLALVLVAILAGMYYWFTTLTPATTVVPALPAERPAPEVNNEPESTTAEAETDMMLVTSPSDELGAIEADIEATNLDNLDAELTAIEAELDAALAE